jgi:DNA polymerase V
MFSTKFRQSKFIIKQIFKPENKINRLLPAYTAHEPSKTEVNLEEPTEKKNITEEKLDLNGYLISHPQDTFLIKVEGESGTNLGVYPGDILIVDQNIESRDGKMVAGVLNNKFTVKFIKVKGKQLFFAAEGAELTDTEITPELKFEMWGIVSYIIHKPQLPTTL